MSPRKIDDIYAVLSVTYYRLSPFADRVRCDTHAVQSKQQNMHVGKGWRMTWRMFIKLYNLFEREEDASAWR